MFLRFLYNTVFGRIILKVVCLPVVSSLFGLFLRSPFSVPFAHKYINDYKIDLNDFENTNFKSFNDFFIRKKKYIEFDHDKKSLISPADSKLLVYKFDENLAVDIKGSIYTMNDIVESKTDLSHYKNGYVLVFRLSEENYHRYHFIDNGKYVCQYEISGVLHTVKPISDKYQVFKKNKRTVSALDTENFGEITEVEVGALNVGVIINNDVKEFKKGDEKGRFELGGSTIVIFINGVDIRPDILENSSKNIETIVKLGECIGIAKP